MTDNEVTIGEVYRLVERVERKVDETNAYAHTQAHQSRNEIQAVVTGIALLHAKDEEHAGALNAVNRRVDNIYRNAAWLAGTLSGFIAMLGQTLLALWPWKHS